MKTVTVQIGNSDDKLSQKEWSLFVNNIHMNIRNYAAEVHFSGGSHSADEWQNACFVFTCKDENLGRLKEKLAERARVWNQDSIAVTVGDTEFV